MISQYPPYPFRQNIFQTCWYGCFDKFCTFSPFWLCQGYLMNFSKLRQIGYLKQEWYFSKEPNYNTRLTILLEFIPRSRTIHQLSTRTCRLQLCLKFSHITSLTTQLTTVELGLYRLPLVQFTSLIMPYSLVSQIGFRSKKFEEKQKQEKLRSRALSYSLVV